MEIDASLVTNMNLDKYLNDYISLPFEPLQEIFRRRNLISLLSEARANLMLEVGCGRRSLFSEFNPPNAAIVVEPISELLEMARGEVSNTKVEFFKGLLSEYVASKDAKQADIVIASSILHGMSDPQAFLTDCKSVLAPGGRLIAIVTNQNSIHRILGVAAGKQDSLDSITQTEKLMQHLHGAYNVGSLTAELEAAEFEVESCYAIFPKLLPHSLMQKAIDEGVIDFRFLEQIDSLMPLLSDFGSELIIQAKKS